jgi:hypothetical protein
MKSIPILYTLSALAGDYPFSLAKINSPFNPPRNTGTKKAMRAAKKRKNFKARQPK